MMMKEKARRTRVRLFVGGVVSGVTPSDLAERFAPFGHVRGVQLVAGKAAGASASSTPPRCAA